MGGSFPKDRWTSGMIISSIMNQAILHATPELADRIRNVSEEVKEKIRADGLRAERELRKIIRDFEALKRKHKRPQP